MQCNVLVCGGSGQVGQELARQSWPEGLKPDLPDRAMLDITDRDAIQSYFRRNGSSLAAVINCAAYTAVDKAEADPGPAYLVNAQGPAWLAEECRRHDLPLVQMSTDYVFDGTSAGFYGEDARPAPLGVYGSSKLAGEIAVLGSNPRTVVLRTAWVISPFGQNFLKTMLRLTQEREELRIVADQLGCPTSAGDIARSLITICTRLIHDPSSPTGCLHFVNSGETTWYDLASEVFRQAAKHGRVIPRLIAISSSDYPTPARRPANSRLSTEKIKLQYGIMPRHWRDVVAEIVDEMFAGQSDYAELKGKNS